MPTRSLAALAAALAASAALAGCAGQAARSGSGNAARQFDIDAFLRAPDTTLAEVLTNTDFLAATRLPAADCATLLQSERSGVLEDLPAAARGHAWLLRTASQPGQVWLVASRRGGERTCHGPLPADTMHGLAQRAGG